MTVASSITSIQYPRNGVTTQWSFPNKIFAAADLTVIDLDGSSPPIVTALVLGTDYTVSNVDIDAGCTVITTVPGILGHTLDIRSNTANTQSTSIKNQGSFLPDLHEEFFDRITREVQDLKRLAYLFAVHGPDTESTPWPSVGTAAARANTNLGFDASGNLALNIAVVTGSLSASSIGQFLYPIYTGEVGATALQYIWGDVRRYGGTLDGVTDCVAAMVSAAASGGLILIAGPMALSSASLATLPNQAIALKSGTTIRGQVGSPITITGTTACNVFRSTDQSDITMLDCAFVGNNVGTATTGYLWQIVGSAAATKASRNWRMIRCGLENFAGYYWVYLDNTAAVSFAMSNFLADSCVITSKAGNCQGSANISITASVLGFSGSDSVLTFYTIKDCAVRNCVADGTFIKNFAIFWSGTFRCKAYSNTLLGFGSDASISNDTGCYALACYDHSHGAGLLPDEIEFYDNTIDVVRDAGVYCAGVNRLTVSQNRISGQTSTANSVIPKGALAFNSPNYLTCIGNKMYSSAIGISLTQDPANTWARFKDNTVEAIPTNGIALQLSGTTGGNAPDIGVDGISIQPAAGATGVKGIYLVFTSAVGCNNLDIQNFDVTACANGLILFAPDSTVPNMGNVRIGQGKLRRISGNNLQWLNGTNAAQRLVIENVEFLDMQLNAVGLFVQSALGCRIRGITFADLTGATFCYYGGGAQGRLADMQFINVPVANRFDSSANRMGVDVPTWTGNDNDFVQDLNPNELIQVIAAANVKYTRQGWTWDRVAAAWKEVRMLTGN